MIKQQKEELTEDKTSSTLTTAWRYSSSDFEPTMKFLNKIDLRELQNPLSLLSSFTSFLFKVLNFFSFRSPPPPSSVLKALHFFTENNPISQLLLWPKPNTPSEVEHPKAFLLSLCCCWLLKLSGKTWSFTTVAMAVIEIE